MSTPNLKWPGLGQDLRFFETLMIATTTAARGYGKFAHRQSISCLILFSPRRSGGEVTFASRRDVDIPIASIVSSRGGGYYDDNDDWMIVSKYLVYGNVDLPRREHWKRHDVYQIDLCDATSVVMCSCGWEDRVSRGRRRRDVVHDDDDGGYYPSIRCAVCRGDCWYVASVFPSPHRPIDCVVVAVDVDAVPLFYQ